MKIWLAITTPRLYEIPEVTVWNVKNIDEFVSRFVKEGKLVIGEFETLINNFTAHGNYIATFETECPEYDCIYILCALNNIGTFHNVHVDVIENDDNPLKNPRAEASRKKCVVLDM